MTPSTVAPCADACPPPACGCGTGICVTKVPNVAPAIAALCADACPPLETRMQQ
eukprot:CAMPEP_0198497786 /NCGR_PEP_ID=MMETSP1462-20131121/6600_1 /TAXON_ID=1333877 /ORGANISM="Brandtodinium nutriculum, Strain RCC3387" /LENGTH=53 /DNA_ID=CAMNT_0044226663 /DNA_START=43 /DNA_END=201 /DNA_ORIENTATION=+